MVSEFSLIFMGIALALILMSSVTNRFRTAGKLIIHGRNDVLVAYEHSTRLAAALENKGVSHYLLSLPWATHGFDYTLNGPGGQLSTFTVYTFLRKILK